MQLGRLEALTQSMLFNTRKSFLVNFLKQELLRSGDGKNANGRLKSANSSSKLSNKACPLICMRDQTMPNSIFHKVRENQDQSVKVVSYDYIYGLDWQAIS